MKWWSWFLMVFAVIWCWLGAWAAEAGLYSFFDPFVIGGGTGVALFPFLIAYALKGRKKNRDWNSFARWFFWLALTISAVQSLRAVRSSQIEADRKAEREMGRQFVQELTALQGRYKSDPRCQFEPPLYSGASFADRESMANSITQLNACLSLYEEMGAEMNRLIQRFEDRTNSSFALSQYRADVLRRFRAGLQKSTAQRQLAAVSRKTWKEETTALYDFALRYSGRIRVIGGEVVINNDSVLAQFNRMLKAASEAEGELIRVETSMQAAGQAKIEELNRMLK